MKIGICGYYGMGNIGDEVILKSLKSVLLKAFPNSEYIIFGKGNLFPFGIRSFLKPYRLLKSCDAFVLGGGGLFTDEESIFVSAFWAFQGLVALFLRKPLLCLGISVGPVKRINRPLVKYVLRRAKLIVVRDKASQSLLRGWGVESFYFPDLAFLFEEDSEETSARGNIQSDRVDVTKKYIVISVRPFIKNNDNLYTIFAQFCDTVIEKFGLDIRLIPFQRGVDFDVKILNTIFDRINNRPHVTVTKFYEDISELIDVIRNAELVVAMRLHAGILAMKANTPFIPLSYMQKVVDLWKDFPDITPVNFSEITLEKLLDRFKKEIVNKIKPILHKNAQDLANLISSVKIL